MTTAHLTRHLTLLAAAGSLWACGARVDPADRQGVVVRVVPSSAEVGPRGSLSFTAAVTGAVVTTVTWSVQEGASGGSVASSGVYSAPATAGTYHVVATSQADATKSAAATVTVTTVAPPAAETPTFSPPPGRYTSAQTVIISSATPGAIIHCTLDGSTPTAASAVCSAPIAVSSTTALRAIATATGYTASAAASATYTIGGSTRPTLLEQLRALSTKRQLFGHQSVGANIMYGRDGTHGLTAILNANPTGGVTLISNPSSLSGFVAGNWAEYELGTNGNPIGKIDEFDRLVRTNFGGQLDYAGMKFCFADIGESTDVAPIWARYQAVMDALEADYRSGLIRTRVIHWTGAILPWVEGGGNLRRAEMNDHIRAKYGSTGRLFDLAGMEQRDSAGTLVFRDDPTTPGIVERIPAMAYEWCADYSGGTASDGHLNNGFADTVALAYIEFMYGVAVP